MPRIPLEVLKCTFFLYRSREDAEQGINTGGTGFFIGIRSSIHQRGMHAFAITNWHVAVDSSFSVIRINLAGGGVDIIEREPHEWFFKQGGYDLAIADGPVFDGNKHDIRALDLASHALTKAHVEALNIGPGEDVFMVGRFIGHDGHESNAPATRFGNISMMPAPMLQGNGATLPSYCIDMHSRTGFSGSPVFAYRTLGSDLTIPRQFAGMGPGSHYMGLLGVHWGQFPELWEITQDGRVIQSVSRIKQPDGYFVPGKYVKGVSGMSCVCPIWAIEELLELDEVKAIMEADNAEITRSRESSRLNPDLQ